MLLLSELPPNVIIEIELQMAQKITNKGKKKRGRRIERKRVLWRSKLKSKGETQGEGKEGQLPKYLQLKRRKGNGAKPNKFEGMLWYMA